MEWSTVTDWLVSHGVRIFIILIISAALYIVLRRLVPLLLKQTVKKRGKSKKAEDEAEKRVQTLARIFMGTGAVLIVLTAGFMILSELGINIYPPLAGFGVIGVALGFGAQYLIRDLIAGFFVLVENQYNIGDWVSIAGIDGSVQEINMRRTVLRDFDGTVHVVPNGEIKTASNYSKEWARVNLNISVAYGTDLDHAIAVINRVGTEMAKAEHWRSLIKSPPQALRVDNLGDSGIDIKVLGETKPIRQWEVMGELRKRIKQAFDEEGIEIPWPHTKVYFGTTPPPRAPTEEPAPPIPPSEILPPDGEGAE
ncbi:MAG: mechanosensitive ion channel family protein [Dehalococcoidia bacterium]|nr:MAG: mechanosensitive ion channel family protein [Dehalococcoidia bacterium]